MVNKIIVRTRRQNNRKKKTYRQVQVRKLEINKTPPAEGGGA